jgi:exonuclease SbcC
LGAEPADYAKIQSTLDQLNSEFTAVPLPKEKARELSEKFATALSKVQRKIVTERNRAAIQGWQDLFSLSDRMRHYELAVLAKAGDLEQQRAALRQHLENLPALPEGGADILQQRFVQADQLCAQTQEQNQHALRMLCIRAEILLDQESPAEDRNMRMNYLMQQLQQGLGQHDITTESLAYEWVSVAAVNDEIYQPLFIRFMQALSNDPEGQLAAPSS